ncbi:uncharacterized protein LOC142605939 [Castanea sativa]|uniref:uncharacterized protein LOC142605939 n=1 Tax=Castanea sativa TaxID=21020 RepID=UPI003F6509C8
MTFQEGLNNLDLVFSLGKTPPTSMTDLLFKAQKYMNGEDALNANGLAGLKSVGIIVTSLEKDVLKYGVQLQFLAMNNEAEYEIVLTSLGIAKALGIKNLKLMTDFKLVVGQITNEYEAKEERMKKYLKLTTQLIDEFNDVKFEQIPSENNSSANEVARLASTEDASVMKELLMEVQTIPRIDELQTLSVQ